MAITKSATAVICLSPYAGGMEIDSIKTAQKLQPYRKTILIAKQECFIANEMKKHSSETVLETVSFSSNFGPSLIFKIRKLILKHGIKNVIFFGASELKSLYFSFLGLNINLIVRHGTTKSHPKKDWFHRLIYSKVNYHVAICEHLANNVKYIIPFGKETQLKVIYPSLNIIPSKSLEYTDKPHHPLQLLHVGRIANGKGQEAAVKACKILYENNIEFNLTLVGGYDEGYKSKFLKFIGTLEYKNSITIQGYTNNVEAFYLNSDIFLFPSDGEGLSNAFIEALTYGLVCISYENTSFPELKEMGFYFHMVENQNIDKLSKTVLSSYQNLSDMSKKSSENRKLTTSIFSTEQELNSYFNILV